MEYQNIHVHPVDVLKSNYVSKESCREKEKTKCIEKKK